jgi:hypothetical protein
MPVIRTRQFEHTITIDGQPVRLRLKRLTVPEYAEFVSMLSAYGQHRGAPAHYADEPADENADDATKAPPIDLTLDDVRAHTDYLKANVVWQREVFAAYVSVVPGDLVEERDGQSAAVTDGGEFYDLCHAQIPVAAILTRLYTENSLSEAQKKTLQSRSGSATGSSAAPRPEPNGPTLATAAAPAVPEDSASVAGVTAPSSALSSGTTDPSSYEIAPCAV